MRQLNEGIELGELTTSQKQNVIRIIPKKDKDKTQIKNWRPLTLGQCDAKIDSKTLADMMIEAMSDLIHPNQIAYIKKRFIGEGIRLIDGIIDYIKEKELSGYMFAIDFLKAFDSYEWEFWERVLRIFGFPEVFIMLLKRHYKNIQSCVVNGGTSTKYFPIKRGIKQGDPPSGLIFILGIELFAIRVRANKMIQGIEVNKMEIKLSAYADDVLNFLKNIQSVRNILIELEKFGEISGLVCNLSKCEAMALGDSKQERITYNNVEIEWVEKMKITGITFGNKSEENRKEDVEEAISKMQTQLQIWSGRNLSILGKIQIVKTFGISQILYISNMLPLYTEEIRKVDKIISNFIWNNKPAKIRKTAMVADYAQGGLKFPNIEAQIKAQKIMWIKRFLVSPDHPWKLIFEWQIEKLGGLRFLRYTNLNIQFIEIIKKQEGLTEFYADLFTAWADYNRCDDISVENVLDQNLFYNQNFKNPIGTSLNHRRCMKKGIFTLRDITNENRIMNFEEIKLKYQFEPADVLLYMGVVKMIPNWVRVLISESKEDVEPLEEKLMRKNSKTIYRKLNNKVIERPVSEQKFQTEYHINHDDFQNIYKLPFLVTIDSKTRAFQFKINHNIYYTNKKLNQIKYKESPLCSFCNDHDETLKHLFIDCTFVKPLWNSLQSLLNYTFTDEEKLFGLYGKIDDNNCDLISHITIITKQCIHLCRCANSKPTFEQINAKIVEIENIEYKIALKNKKLERHLTKWKLFSSYKLAK